MCYTVDYSVTRTLLTNEWPSLVQPYPPEFFETLLVHKYFGSKCSNIIFKNVPKSIFHHILVHNTTSRSHNKFHQSYGYQLTVCKGCLVLVQAASNIILDYGFAKYPGLVQPDNESVWISSVLMVHNTSKTPLTWQAKSSHFKWPVTSIINISTTTKPY